jgi:hypothetical protein
VVIGSMQSHATVSGMAHKVTSEFQRQSRQLLATSCSQHLGFKSAVHSSSRGCSQLWLTYVCAIWELVELLLKLHPKMLCLWRDALMFVSLVDSAPGQMMVQSLGFCHSFAEGVGGLQIRCGGCLGVGCFTHALRHACCKVAADHVFTAHSAKCVF